MHVICGVCHDLFACTEDEVLVATRCGHVYHIECLERWFEIRCEYIPFVFLMNLNTEKK